VASKTEEQSMTEAFEKGAGTSSSKSTATTAAAPEAQGTKGVTNDEPNLAPQGPVGGATIYGTDTPVPQTGGVHPSNLGEYGIVSGQLPEAIVDPVREAEEEAAKAAETTPEENAEAAHTEIGEPEVHGTVKTPGKDEDK
jgi:hypothetical protein